MPSRGRIVDYLQAPGGLTERLATISARKQLQSAAVGLRIAGQQLFASVGSGQGCTGEAPQARIRVGCLAKILTATLIAEAVAARQLEWGTEINEILQTDERARCGLARISVHQLLNHTHGLDGPDVVQTPLTASGRVDAPALCRQLAARPLSRPGSLYSYNDTGARLAAATLERLSGKRYGDLLRTSEVMGCSVRAWQQDPVTVCPATGQDLELTIPQWLTFLDSHLQAEMSSIGPARQMAELREAPITLPGWSPAEQAAARGWKYYGGGWFGHNADMRDLSVILRLNAREATAIVLVTSGGPAFFVLAGLFGTALPEFANLRPPQLLAEHDRAQLRIEPYRGIYTQSHSRIEITALSANNLGLAIRSRDAADEPPRTLHPAPNHIFFLEPGGPPMLPYVQFVSSSGSDHFDYLWNGKKLWRRD